MVSGFTRKWICHFSQPRVIQHTQFVYYILSVMCVPIIVLIFVRSIRICWWLANAQTGFSYEIINSWPLTIHIQNYIYVSNSKMTQMLPRDKSQTCAYKSKGNSKTFILTICTEFCCFYFSLSHCWWCILVVYVCVVVTHIPNIKSYFSSNDIQLRI